MLFDCKLEFLESFLVNVSEDERVTHRLTGLHRLDLAEFFFRHYVLEHRTVGIVVYQTQLVGEGSDYERIVRLIGYRLELIPIGIGFVKDVVEPNACRLVGGQLASVGVEDGAVGVDEILGTDGILRERAQVVVLDVCLRLDVVVDLRTGFGYESVLKYAYQLVGAIVTVGGRVGKYRSLYGEIVFVTSLVGEAFDAVHA